MEIHPVQPVKVQLICDMNKAHAFMLSLSDTVLKVICHAHFDINEILVFKSEYFKGEGQVKSSEISKYCYRYTIEIFSIKFQPGLLINTKL